MEMIGRDDMKPSVKLELLEREQYKCELRLKEKLRRTFLDEKYLNVSYPSEVYCISPRAAENNYFDPDAYWTIHQDSQYSTFADRNMSFFDSFISSAKFANIFYTAKRQSSSLFYFVYFGIYNKK